MSGSRMPSRIMKALEQFLANSSSGIISILSFLLLAVIAAVDYLLGYEISFSIFYLIPVGLTTWFGVKHSGIMLACVAALLWLAADKHSGHTYSHLSILYWNTAVRLSFFFIVARLLKFIKKRLREEENLADIDSLTNAYNSRAFYEKIALEIERAKRYKRPFSLAYIDLDNFKEVNDTLGHTEGDELLKNIVIVINDNIRKNDFIGRLGGDEFVVFFPETDYKALTAAIHKIRSLLNKQMKKNKSSVTFSIGAVTYKTPPLDPKIMVKFADELMYAVKKKGKNGILHKLVS